MLNIVKASEGVNTVFELEGRLDTVTAPDLEKEIRACVEEAEELVLNIEKLEYISSAGLRVLLFAQKSMNGRAGKLIIRGASEAVMEIFEVTGFSDILNIE